MNRTTLAHISLKRSAQQGYTLMSILTYIALIACLAVLGVGFITTWLDRGYAFDLRRRRPRRRRPGGRRAGDLAEVREAILQR